MVFYLGLIWDLEFRYFRYIDGRSFYKVIRSGFEKILGGNKMKFCLLRGLNRCDLREFCF